MSRPGLARHLVDSTIGGELSSPNDFNTAQNYVMNSRFDIAQVGTSFTSQPNPVYLIDRWQYTFDGSTGSYNAGQTVLAPQDTVPGFPGFALAINQSGAPSGDSLRVLRQFIENVRTLAGKTCTLSFWAVSDVNRPISILLRQNFGSGGSPDVDTASQTINLTTILTKYVLTFNLPSLTGKTIGGFENCVELRLSLPINTAFFFEITQVMLNEGPFAAPWSYMGHTYGGELALCQRFYEQGDDGVGAIIVGNGNGGGGYCHQTSFLVQKRVEPSITYTGTWTITDKNGSGTTGHTAALYIASTRSFNTSFIGYSTTGSFFAQNATTPAWKAFADF